MSTSTERLIEARFDQLEKLLDEREKRRDEEIRILFDKIEKHQKRIHALEILCATLTGGVTVLVGCIKAYWPKISKILGS